MRGSGRGDEGGTRRWGSQGEIGVGGEERDREGA
jgi:hypothetical protein